MEKMELHQDKLVNDFISHMYGYFYQTWYEDYSGPIDVLRDVKRDDPYGTHILEALKIIIKKVDEMPEVSSFLKNMTGDYGPDQDGLTTIEWLVLFKNFMEGNTSVFEHKNVKTKAARPEYRKLYPDGR